MNLSLTLGGLAAATLLSIGLASAHAQDESSSRAQADFERLRSLAGEWQAFAPDGSPMGDWSFRVTAGGSAVVETLFVGQDHEMMTVYHMEDGELVLTHYCVLGNQPHMHATEGTSEDTIAFEATHVGNLEGEDAEAMKQGRITFEEDGSVTTLWSAFAGDEPTHEAGFTLRRADDAR